MSTELRDASILSKPESTSSLLDHQPLPDHDGSLFSGLSTDTQRGHKHTGALSPSSFCSSQRPRSFPAGYSPSTPFPSQAYGSWLHPSFASSWSGYPTSLPSCLSQKDNSGCTGESCLSGYKFLSLPGTHSTVLGSLEQPLSLRSNPPSANLYHHTLSPYSWAPQGPACCAQCPADAFSRGAAGSKHPWPDFHPAYGPYCKSAGPYFNLRTIHANSRY